MLAILQENDGSNALIYWSESPSLYNERDLLCFMYSSESCSEGIFHWGSALTRVVVDQVL